MEFNIFQNDTFFTYFILIFPFVIFLFVYFLTLKITELKNKNNLQFKKSKNTKE